MNASRKNNIAVTVLAAVLATGMTTATAAQANLSAAVVPVNIQAQPIGDALNEFARQTGLQVVLFADVSTGITAPQVSGDYAPRVALEMLLAHTGLGYEYVNERTVAIRAQKLKTEAPLSNDRRVPENGDLRLAQTEQETGAQSEPAKDTNSDSQGNRDPQDRLEEIIVTARKTNERLQDVPVTVTAIGGDELKARNAVDLKDVLGSVPGLAFSGVDRGQTSYNIRGVASIGGFMPTTGIYLDDIALVSQPDAGSGAFDAVLFDMERIEVLKGPQGTLYGGSAMGGAIKYVSARPDLDEMYFNASAGIGTTAHGAESYNAEGVANLPIVDNVLAMRAGVYYRREGGFIDNVAGADIEDTSRSSTPFPTYTPLTKDSLSTNSQKDYNSRDTYVGRLSLLWEPDSSWSIRPAAMYQDTKIDNPTIFFTNLPDYTASYRLLPQQMHDRAGTYSLDIVKRWRAVELTSLTSYIERKVTWDRDYAFFIGYLVPSWYTADSFTHFPTQERQFSQELRIASAPASASRLSWLAGVFYSDRTEHLNSYVRIYDVGIPNDLGFYADERALLDQRALFGEMTYRLVGNLDVTVGARIFEIEVANIATLDGPFAGGFSQPKSNSKENGVNPKLGLAYTLQDDHLLYASAAKGFRPGQAVTVQLASQETCAADLARLGFDSVPTHYESDDLWSYEVGSKNEFASGRFMMNGSLFYTDWKKIQQNVTLPGCGNLGFTVNAGDARVKGVELETRLDVTPAVRIGGNVTYTDAKISKSAFGGVAQKGDEILSVPEWMASAYTSYSTALNPAWDLTLRADYQYRSRQKKAFINTQIVTFSDGVRGGLPLLPLFQEGYDVINAYMALDHGSTNVRLYVSNLTDAMPILSQNLANGASKAETLRPRTIGVEVRQRF